jgi:hypothetical protein
MRIGIICTLEVGALQCFDFITHLVRSQDVYCLPGILYIFPLSQPLSILNFDVSESTNKQPAISWLTRVSDIHDFMASFIFEL